MSIKGLYENIDGDLVRQKWYIVALNKQGNILVYNHRIKHWSIDDKAEYGKAFYFSNRDAVLYRVKRTRSVTYKPSFENIDDVEILVMNRTSLFSLLHIDDWAKL